VSQNLEGVGISRSSTVTLEGSWSRPFAAASRRQERAVVSAVGTERKVEHTHVIVNAAGTGRKGEPCTSSCQRSSRRQD
jgi:hypothetical protein